MKLAQRQYLAFCVVTAIPAVLIGRPEIGTAIPPTSVSVSTGSGTPVMFDHRLCLSASPGAAACHPTYTAKIHAGDLLTVIITNTDSTAFTYSIAGIPKPSTTGATATGINTSPALPTDVVTLTQVHDATYGGYVITIHHKNNASTVLGDATFAVTVVTSEIVVGFGSGFTGSGLTNPAYGVRDSSVLGANGAAAHLRPTFVTQPSRQDAVALGAAAFVHVSHTTVLPFLGLTFGLGIDNQQGTTFYLGPSVLFANKAALTVGAALGAIHTPPSGVQVGDSVSSNALNNLGTRTEAKFFVGISYAFIGGSQAALQKPFLGSNSPPAAVSTSGVSSGNNNAGTVAKANDGEKATSVGILAHPLTITATKPDGSPLSQGVVKWQADNSGTIQSPTGVTDNNGQNSANVMLGADGPTHVTALVTDPTTQLALPPAVFTVTRCKQGDASCTPTP